MHIKTGIIIASVLVAGGAVAATTWMFFRQSPEFFETEATLGGFKGVIVNGLTERPLPNAVVSALSSVDGTVVESVRSDRSGRFALTLADGEYTVVGALDGYVSRGDYDAGRVIFIDDGTQFVNAKLRLWPPAKVHGRVVAGLAGIAAAVDVRYKRDASGAGPYAYRSVTADENGYFSIEDAYAGITTIGISADGFASVVLDDVVLKSGVSLDIGDIPLRDGVSLYGQVLDATSKQPINRAQVDVLDVAGKLLASTKTSGDGSYRLAPIDMAQVRVEVSADGYHAARYRMRLGGKANHNLPVNLRRAWGMTLNVQNMTGREPIMTHIQITDTTSDKVVYNDTLANGTYELKSIKGGPFLVEAFSADRLTRAERRSAVGDTVTLRLRPFARIIAHVLDSDGSDLDNGQYRFYFRPDSSTAEDSPTPWLSFAASTIEIGDLHEGLYRIEVRKTGETRTSSSNEFLLRQGDVRELAIRMTSGGAIRGHVVSTESGYNLARVSVTLDDGKRTVTTDNDGYFIIDELPDEPFSLSIKVPREEGEATVFGDLTVAHDQVVEREFRVSAPRMEARERRREEMRRRIENGEAPWAERGYSRRRNSRGGGAEEANGTDFIPSDWNGDGAPPPPPDWNGDGAPPPPPHHNWNAVEGRSNSNAVHDAQRGAAGVRRGTHVDANNKAIPLREVEPI